MEPNERIEQVLGSLRALVEDLAEEGRAKTEAIETEAEASVGRYYDTVEELDVARREITKLEAERETLPNRAYRAGLDEDYEREDELKARYKNLRPTLEALRERVGELEAEVAGLIGRNPGVPGGTFYDAQLTAYTPCRDAYHEAVAPLFEIEREVGAILRPAIAPLAGGEKGWGDTLRGIRDQRASDPEVRRRSLEKRGIRVESGPTPMV